MHIWQIALVVIVWTGIAALAWWGIRRLFLAAEANRRLFEAQTAPQTTEQMGFLRRWLFLAGYRDPRASTWFIAWSVLAFSIALAIAAAFYFTGLYQLMIRSAQAVPGGVGEVFLPAVFLAPWLILIAVSAIPLLIVRRARRRRVEMVEQDLPLALDLLATLSEAGLGFDAALARIYETRLAERPLANELRSFQSDQLSGRPRVQCLRRLSSRLSVPAVSIFVSALVQAEQLGMGIAGILRRQADDLRDRRRERALAFAMSLAVKRVVPMVICFLPGLFVWTLGPFFVQLFQLVDSFTQVRGLGN